MKGKVKRVGALLLSCMLAFTIAGNDVGSVFGSQNGINEVVANVGHQNENGNKNVGPATPDEHKEHDEHYKDDKTDKDKDGVDQKDDKETKKDKDKDNNNNRDKDKEKDNKDKDKNGSEGEDEGNDDTDEGEDEDNDDTDEGEDEDSDEDDKDDNEGGEENTEVDTEEENQGSASISVDENEVEVSISGSNSYKMVDVTVTNTTGKICTIDVTSSDSSIASANLGLLGKSVVIKGEKPGVATVTVSCKVDGKVVDSKDITVTVYDECQFTFTKDSGCDVEIGYSIGQKSKDDRGGELSML